MTPTGSGLRSECRSIVRTSTEPNYWHAGRRARAVGENHNARLAGLAGVRDRSALLRVDAYASTPPWCPWLSVRSVSTPSLVAKIF